MKLAISGTYSTGKTTTTLALAFYTGLPRTHAKTMREILPIALPGKRLDQLKPVMSIEQAGSLAKKEAQNYNIVQEGK